MTHDIRDTDEQKNLRDLFIPSYKPTMTTACPLCLPGCKRKSNCFFERGTCGDLVAMRCNNCGFIRTSKPRVSKGITKGQHRAIDRINRYFAPNKERLAEWEIKPTEYGGVWVSVRTEGNVWTARGAHIYIGKRGSVEVKSVYDLCTSKEATEATRKHYEFMLRNR